MAIFKSLVITVTIGLCGVVGDFVAAKACGCMIGSAGLMAWVRAWSVGIDEPACGLKCPADDDGCPIR